MRHAHIIRPLASALAVAAAAICPARAVDTPEVEPNESKATATPVAAPLLAGDTLSGASTGASTLPGGASVDYFRVQTAAAPLAIYQHRLVNVSGTTHTANIRGLNQVNGVRGTLDALVQTNVTTPQRYCQWYGFGRQEQLYFRVAGSATTVQPYQWALETQTVSPINLGTFQAGPILMNWENQGHNTDTDIWVYNEHFFAIPEHGNDDNSVAGGGSGIGLQSRLERTYVPGRYYIAVTNFQFANHLPSPPDDDFRSGVLLDFAEVAANSSQTTNVNLSFTISDSLGATQQVSAFKSQPFEIQWFCFDVAGIKPFGACCIDGECQFISECRCAEVGGVYAGDGVPCAGLTCPLNDECPEATFLPVPGSTTGTLRMARPDTPPLCGPPIAGRGVWFGVVGTGTTIQVSTCNAVTTLDTRLHVYCGPCGGLTCIAGNDNDPACPFNPLHSSVSFCSQAGSVYYILVEGGGVESGDFRLDVTHNGSPCPPPPGCGACAVTCVGTPESELCGQNLNGGCNSVPPVFEAIACGQTICGTAFADGALRDTDWYQFSIATPQAVTWTVRAEFPVAAFLMRINSCAPIDIDFLAVADGPPCEDVVAQTFLDPGTYALFVSVGRATQGIFSGFPCGTGNDYRATLHCSPIPTACEPLSEPLFTIDRPSLVGPLAGFRASDVLTLPGPAVQIPGPNLGLENDCDALDAISFDNIGTGPGELFVLRFSVDRATAGAVPPEPILDGLGLPYNVQHQADRRQAAADEYISLLLYTRSGPIFPFSSVSENNTKTRNQSDAGGVDYSLLPVLSPDQFNPDDQSNVDGGAKVPGAALGPPTYIFFSVTADSPSLAILPGTVSGADVYLDTNTAAAGGEVLYVAPVTLGLLPGDDIDALTVFDDGDHIFEDHIDEVQFSLARGSPSLQLTGRSPADLFRSRGAGVFVVYTLAEELGLLAADNVDAIEYSFCSDVLDCAIRWGIGFVDCAGAGCIGARGDANCDGAIDFFDIDPFLLALFNPAAYQATYCGGSFCRVDCDCSGFVDFFDIDPFLQCLFSFCPACE